MPEAQPPTAADQPVSRFALMGNFLPLCMLATMAAASLLLADDYPARLGLFTGILYIAPPLIARLLMFVYGRPEGRGVGQASHTFRLWWVLLQLQMPFNRLPWLEELLRLVPGLYPLWLKMWGAQVHPATFWAPGARTLDRPYLEIDRGAVIGTDALISGHLSRMQDGCFVVDIAPVTIGSHTMIGARSNIGPGCVIGPGETLTATTRLAPYNHYLNGKRQ